MSRGGRQRGGPRAGRGGKETKQKRLRKSSNSVVVAVIVVDVEVAVSVTTNYGPDLMTASKRYDMR